MGIDYHIIMNSKIRNKNEKNHSKKTSRYGLKLHFENVNWDKTEKIFFADRKLLQKQLEKEEKRKARAKEILKLLAGGAVIGFSLIIPTAPMILAPFIGRKKYDQSTFNQTIKRLKKQKLVKIVEEEGQTVVRITEAGRMRALRYKLEEMQIKKPQAWDRKWRIVIFDIPEKYKRMRDIFRRHLKVMDFQMLQKSVWVHPYPCSQEIEFLRQVYNVGINVTYIVAEKVESSDDLKSHFQL